MKDVRVAKRYASALIQVAQRDGIVDAVAKDLDLIERDLENVGFLRAVIVQPLVSEERKYSVVDHAFSDRITATSLNFIKLLIKKRREVLISVCIREFRVLCAELSGTVEATVTTAISLSSAQSERLIVGLNTLTGKNVNAKFVQDPGIIGGTVVRIGDNIIDGSVRGSLERLEQTLLGTRAMGGVS